MQGAAAGALHHRASGQTQYATWHIDNSVGIQQFQNDLSLTDEQIETIARWVDSGAPLGNPKDLPPTK
jgi:hypothetical protein